MAGPSTGSTRCCSRRRSSLCMYSPSSAEGADEGLTPGRTGRIGVAVLGSTGSIGSQALDVLESLPDAFRIVAIAAGGSSDRLAEQAVRLRPTVVWLSDAGAARRIIVPPGVGVVGGPDALVELATRDDVDLVVVGTGGIVSLVPVLAALRAGKVVATANKETLVAGGHLVMPLARALAAGVAATSPTDPLASP